MLHVDEGLQQLVAGGDDLGVGLKTALGGDQVGHFGGEVHVGDFQIAGLNLAHPVAAAWLTRACGSWKFCKRTWPRVKVVPSERVTLIWPWGLMAKEATVAPGAALAGAPVASILIEPIVDNPALL